MDYDIVIVGAGLYGSTIANLAKSEGMKPLVLEKNKQTSLIIIRTLEHKVYIMLFDISMNPDMLTPESFRKSITIIAGGH